MKTTAKKVTKVETVEVEYVELTLTMEDAQHLANVLGNWILGVGPERESNKRIYFTLSDAGVRAFKGEDDGMDGVA